MTHNPPASISRHARAIRILRCLQSGPHFNAKKLADCLHVSRRTIHRDLNLIRDAGIAIDYDQTHEGYRIVTEEAIAPPDLREEELTRLILAAQFSILQGFPRFATAVREGMTKLMCGGSPLAKTVLSRLLNACLVRPRLEMYSDEVLHTLEMLFVAIGRQRQIRLSLRTESSARPLRTKLAPYRIVMDWNEWLVVGRSSVHRCTRAFEIAHIENVELTEDSYSVPRGYYNGSAWPEADGQAKAWHGNGAEVESAD